MECWEWLLPVPTVIHKITFMLNFFTRLHYAKLFVNIAESKSFLFTYNYREATEKEKGLYRDKFICAILGSFIAMPQHPQSIPHAITSSLAGMQTGRKIFGMAMVVV